MGRKAEVAQLVRHTLVCVKSLSRQNEKTFEDHFVHDGKIYSGWYALELKSNISNRIVPDMV
jgi:hypothetical protein